MFKYWSTWLSHQEASGQLGIWVTPLPVWLFQLSISSPGVVLCLRPPPQFKDGCPYQQSSALSPGGKPTSTVLYFPFSLDKMTRMRFLGEDVLLSHTMGLQISQISNAALFSLSRLCLSLRFVNLFSTQNKLENKNENERFLNIVFMWNYGACLQSSILLKSKWAKVTDLCVRKWRITFIHHLLTGL